MTALIDGRWMLVVPPEGAARQVGGDLWEALCAALPENRRKRFDTAANLKAFDRLLRQPGDDMAVDLMGQALVVQALDFAATHLVVVALSPVTFFTVDLLKRRGLKTLHWFVEDFRQALYWEKVLPAYTHWLAIQRGPMEAACSKAGARFEYLPTAAGKIPEGALRPWTERRFDAAFVGLPSPYRVAVLEAMNRAGISLAIAGPGWDGYTGPLRPRVVNAGWLDAEATLTLLGEARLGVHAPYEDASVDRENGHVSPRLYEVLACGCGLLCEDSPLCREALAGFAPGFFAGAEAVVPAAKRMLERPMSSAEQAFQREAIRLRHGYTQRFEAMAGMA